MVRLTMELPRPTPGGRLHADIGLPVRPPAPDDQRDYEEGAHGEQCQEYGWDHIYHLTMGVVALDLFGTEVELEDWAIVCSCVAARVANNVGIPPPPPPPPPINICF